MATEQDGSSELPWGIPPSGHRLPGATHPGAVSLRVADLDRSVGWYERVLGMRVLRREAGSAVLAATGADDALVELYERSGVAPVPRGGRPGLYHFALLLPDRAALGRFLAHLVEVRERFGAADHLVSEALYLHDPDNLGIEVYADRPRADWQHSGRQLRMTTDPLDVDGVMAAGEGQRWDAMPAGTVMGHVHLHVGDLDRAAAFYHDALGLDKTVWGYPGALFLSAGGYHHHLGLNTWAQHSQAAGEDEARMLEWQLVVPNADDVAAAASALQAKGASVVEDGSDIVARDPWGTAVRLTTA